MNASDIFSNKVVQAASIGVASFAAGGVLGYVLGKRSKAEEKQEFEQMTLEYSVDMGDVELGDDERAYFSVDSLVESFSEEDEVAPKIEALSESERHIEWIGPDPRDEPPPKEEYVDFSNVFEDTGDDDWDEEAELSNRSNEEPYIITLAEFMDNDTGFTQTTLTYYSGDQMVTDDDDTPVYNYSNVLGDNLKFGHGSNDKDIVYIRNVKRRAEYQVIQFDGHYAQEKLGLEAQESLENELRHAEPRRFRPNE